MIGIILSGGRATRLGPLAAQLSKCLVTVGSKPQLVRQYQQLRSLGCDDVYVVVSPDAEGQVKTVIERAGLPSCSVAVQHGARGPVDAIDVGLCTAALERVPVHRRGDDSCIVLMSDTLLGSAAVATLAARSVVVTAFAPSSRPFCRWVGDRWEDSHATEGDAVAVGAYHFRSTAELSSVIARIPFDAHGEISMDKLLNELPELKRVHVTGWRDVGDVAALADANRANFINRSFNDLGVDDRGYVTKRGPDLEHEIKAMAAPPADAAHLFPRVIDSGKDFYTMEFIDLPNLAELWLYWPSRPDMWTHIGSELVRQLETYLWPRGNRKKHDAMVGRAYQMYHHKLVSRNNLKQITPNRIWLNEREVVSGRALVDAVAHEMLRLVWTAEHHQGWVHGDPNFTNVLWSLRTGHFKLLDARGYWGGQWSIGDTRYDLGKIANSPLFSAVVHGLYDLRPHTVLELVGMRPVALGYEFNIWPQRTEEESALRETLPLTNYDLDLLTCYMLLSSAPLHDGDEQVALMLAAADRADRSGITCLD